MLLVSWLTAPWRWAARLLTGLASVLAGRQPEGGAMTILVAGLAVAVTRTLHQGQWTVGGVLVFVALSTVLCPFADAAISRRAEMSADRFTAEHGLAVELAAALHAMNDGRCAASWWRRLLASHPSAEQRIQALLAATAASGIRDRREAAPTGIDPGDLGAGEDPRGADTAGRSCT